MGSSLCKKGEGNELFNGCKMIKQNEKGNRKMINTIIFDIGRVLVEWDWQGYLQGFGFSGEKTEKLAKAIFQSEYWKETDRGVWSDEEILQSFIKVVPEYEEDVRAVWDDMGKCIWKCEYTDEWIEELKERGYKVYYLSNYGKTLREKSKEALNFTENCHGGIFSYEIQKIKPDYAIYKALVEKYSLIPKQCVFLDDTMENIEAARECGFHGIQFITYEQAKKELEEILSKF